MIFLLRKEAIASTWVCWPFRDSKFPFASQAGVNGSFLPPVLSRHFERLTSCLLRVRVATGGHGREEGNLRRAGPTVAAAWTVLSGCFPSKTQAVGEKSQRFETE